MAALAMDLSANLRRLVDDRLESVEKYLLARGTPRSERLEIIAGLENQIFEMLAARGVDEPSRRDVLDVLSRLDPPEAYGGETSPPPSTPAPQPQHPPQQRSEEVGTTPRVCWVSVCGLSIGASILVMSVAMLALEAATLGLALAVLGAMASLVCGIIGIVRIRSSRKQLRGLPVAAISTFLYPTVLFAYFGMAFGMQQQSLTVLAALVGLVAVVAWMNVGLYRLVAIGHRRAV